MKRILRALHDTVQPDQTTFTLNQAINDWLTDRLTAVSGLVA